MQLLLDAGADVAALDNDDKTPLMLCSCQPQGQAVALLLEAGANLHAEDSAGYTPIMEAVQHGHTAVVEQLLAAGADPGAVVHGITLLHMAAQSGHTAVLQQLLAAMGAGQRGVVVDAVARGATALHLAAQNGHTGCVELLIAAGADASKLYGADPEAPTNLGATALHCVVQMGHLALVPLLATPANLHHLWQGQTPLHLALGVGCQPSMVQALMAAGAPLGVRNAAGATALVQAARSTDAGVRALLPAMVRRECVNYKQPQQSSHDQQQEQPVQQAMEACLVSIGVAVNVLMLAHAAAVSNSTRDVATSCIQVVKEMVGGSDTSQLVQVVLLACKLWDLEHPGWGTSKVLLVMQGLTSACCAALEPLMQQRWRVTSRLEQLVPAPQQHQQPANAAAGGNDARAADSGSHLSAQAMAAATGGDWPRFVQLWEQLMGRQPAQASRLMSQVQEQPISGKLCGKVGLCEALLEAWQAARQQVASRMQQELTAAVVSAVQAGQGHMAAARSLLRRGWRKKGARPCRG
jgi:ankyrin repeat protein